MRVSLPPLPASPSVDPQALAPIAPKPAAPTRRAFTHAGVHTEMHEGIYNVPHFFKEPVALAVEKGTVATVVYKDPVSNPEDNPLTVTFSKPLSVSNPFDSVIPFSKNLLGSCVNFFGKRCVSLSITSMYVDQKGQFQLSGWMYVGGMVPVPLTKPFFDASVYPPVVLDARTRDILLSTHTENTPESTRVLCETLWGLPVAKPQAPAEPAPQGLRIRIPRSPSSSNPTPSSAAEALSTPGTPLPAPSPLGSASPADGGGVEEQKGGAETPVMGSPSAFLTGPVSLEGVTPETATQHITRISTEMVSRLNPGHYHVPQYFDTPAHVVVAPQTTATVVLTASHKTPQEPLSLQPFDVQFSHPIQIQNPSSSLKPFSGAIGPYLNAVADRCAKAHITSMGFNEQGQFRVTGWITLFGFIKIQLASFFDPEVYPQIHMDEVHFKNQEYIARPPRNNRRIDTERLLASLWSMTPKSDVHTEIHGTFNKTMALAHTMGRTSMGEGPATITLDAAVTLKPDHTVKVRIAKPKNREKVKPRGVRFHTPVLDCTVTAKTDLGMNLHTLRPLHVSGEMHADVTHLHTTTTLLNNGAQKGTATTVLNRADTSPSETSLREPVHADIVFQMGEDLKPQVTGANMMFDVHNILQLPPTAWMFGITLDPSHTMRCLLGLKVDGSGRLAITQQAFTRV